MQLLPGTPLIAALFVVAVLAAFGGLIRDALRDRRRGL
jgi:uncharacterized membrane protein YeiH